MRRAMLVVFISAVWLAIVSIYTILTQFVLRQPLAPADDAAAFEAAIRREMVAAVERDEAVGVAGILLEGAAPVAEIYAGSANLEAGRP
ncbi:MAG: hypothetical protein GYB68_08220, partial [Chloroflexi bacterium]|nr:hypothetical protein [Chloroflexota bacterium]